MRIVIAGAGEVGFHLAKQLAQERQDITLIDLDQEKLRYVSNYIDIATIRGNSTSSFVLEQATIGKADLFIAVTNSEENNLATCMIAKHLGAKKTVARISNVEYLLHKDRLDLSKLGIDELISPESLAAREIKRLLREAALTDTFEFDKGSLSLIGINIDENSQLNKKSLIEMGSEFKDHNFVTVAILRNAKTIIPHGKTIFETNDHAYFIANPSGVERLIDISGKTRKEIKNVMIMGGSKIGYHAARRLSNKYSIKLIEKDKDRSAELADLLPNTLVINGDCSNVGLLKEEGIDDTDAFVAVTGNSETNIISCLLAKNYGVNKTIALVENMDYIHLSQNIGVDTMINKKLIAANFISRYIRQGEVISLAGIHGVDAEILEFEVHDNSRITKNELKDINFPKSAVIGGVVRRGVGYTVQGNFQFEPKDRVVVLSQPECLHKVESFFK
ncbi:MAG: Trk system potassium transporter TrkA [Cyclobacteriaceae bacterium]